MESRERGPDLLLARLVGCGYIDCRKAVYYREPTKDLLLLKMCSDDNHVSRQSRRDVLDWHTKTVWK
jgi:hypothetical protein